MINENEMKWKCTHYRLTSLLMESRVKFWSPQNMSGASQQNSVAAFSQTKQVDGDLF